MASDSCVMNIRGVRLLDGCIKLRCEKLSNVCQVNKEFPWLLSGIRLV